LPITVETLAMRMTIDTRGKIRECSTGSAAHAVDLYGLSNNSPRQ
jgi:hypothetical protein